MSLSSLYQANFTAVVNPSDHVPDTKRKGHVAVAGTVIDYMMHNFIPGQRKWNLTSKLVFYNFMHNEFYNRGIPKNRTMLYSAPLLPPPPPVA